MALATFGLVIYNLAQKNQPDAVHPFQILSIAYIVAAIISVTIYRAIPNLGTASVKEALVPATGLACSIICVELGFLWIYRSGWEVGIANTFSNIAASAILLPFSVLFLQDKLEPTNLFGVVLCLFGLFFIAR